MNFYKTYLLEENLGGQYVLCLYETIKIYVPKEENNKILIFDLNNIYLPQIYTTTGRIMSGILPDVDGAGKLCRMKMNEDIFKFYVVKDFAGVEIMWHTWYSDHS